MTDKQIIIDNVPVQDCCYFDYENDGYEDSCYIHQNECSAQNCYYKQLKRKEQECERLEQTLAEIKEIMKKHCRKCKKHKFYYFQLCCTCKYTDILQKISEVLNDR